MDKKEAHKLLGRFQHCAYQLSKLEEFQNATRLLYGEVWVVKPDIVQRMTFDCTACHKVMNSVVAVKEHTFSEAHMKVLDNIKQKMYKRSLSWSQVITLKDLLQNSYVQAVGLQMIEEYKTGKKIYYKCILCGAHSDVESMYNHVIGAKHTERYIEMRDERKSIPFMTTKVREECRDMIVKEEGVCLNDMKTIIGADYYPYMWEKNNRIRYRTSTRNSTPMSSMTNLTLSCSSLYESEAINLLKREVSILPKTEACTLPKPSKSSRSPERTFEDCETRMINKAMECRPPGRSSEAGALETKSKDKKKSAASIFKLADQIEHMFL
ncbi:uncharacterized protein LOC122247049 [Penaeus japonicus]|uniref:uncharacterized protein LOC122247049 n=1 Tax=Penaeus japonicus TaxID=27405 RepID=UPI001C711252|nr:uncharacterized protein LOC122247049 [Penaeus japonicus]XP_042861956.1 uncharacterized protein LOC122247049 [Penaeus japonicus]XP_042861967.1 uncharacterized protein LOC122247049 [Penaeus japonicus]XP_042861972.1 uncharacterized protein LOC122247049 [Penaeus japonicus]